MKRLMTWIAIAAGLWLSASIAQARNYGVAGCGLGSLVLGPDKMQIFAATTNATGMQTSGITFGTSNCVAPEEAAMLNDQEDFVALNLSTLSKEMAQGSGESLQAFSQKLGCNNEVYPEFTSQLQDTYQQIFKAPGAVAVLDATKAVMQKNEVLSAGCQHIRI